MSALRWLYTVVAGFAVVESLRTFALDTEGNVDFRFNGDLVLLLVFMSVVVRFAHGAIRHFYKWYEEKAEGWNWYQPLVDFFGLFLEAFFFLLMALTLNDHSQFAVYYFFLLVADGVWVSFRPVGETPYRNWLVANSLFLLITIPVFLAWRDHDAVLVATLAGMTIVHHILDYVAPGNWHYYFNGVPRPCLVDRIDQHLATTFLNAGNLVWAVISLLWAVITLQLLRDWITDRLGGAR